MYIGRPLPRVEDDRLLTGRGRFTDDGADPRQAGCAFVRSPPAHARIAAIRTARASSAQGVLAVLTGADYEADGLKPIDHVPNPIDIHDITKRAFDNPRQWPHLPLTRCKAQYASHPVAVVIVDA